jgi:AcrR family transcriptional regulator
MGEPASAPRRTQEERRTEAERRLVAAAAELVADVGPSRVTLASVGQRAGYSRGLATHHFGSKGALMQRLVDAVTAQVREAVIEESRSDSPMDQLFGLVRTYFRVVSNLAPLNRARLVLWADAVATDSPDVRRAMLSADREFREELAKRIERGVAAGQFPSCVDPHGLGTIVVAMLRGVALQKLLDNHVDLDACRIEIEQLLIHRMDAANGVTPDGAERMS